MTSVLSMLQSISYKTHVRALVEPCKCGERFKQTMFAWVCELQTPKPEHGCKIRIDCFFGQQVDTLVGQVTIFLIVKKKLKIIR